jgi:hypothetical protein
LLIFKNIHPAKGDLLCAFRVLVPHGFWGEVEISLLRGTVCESVGAPKIVVVVLFLRNLDWLMNKQRLAHVPMNVSDKINKFSLPTLTWFITLNKFSRPYMIVIFSH